MGSAGRLQKEAAVRIQTWRLWRGCEVLGAPREAPILGLALGEVAALGPAAAAALGPLAALHLAVAVGLPGLAAPVGLEVGLWVVRGAQRSVHMGRGPQW